MGTSVRLDDGEIARLLNDGSTDANFADKFVGEEAVRQISEALANNVSKTRVFLDRNCIGADGAAALGDMLKVSHFVTHEGITQTDVFVASSKRSRLAMRCRSVPRARTQRHVGAEGIYTFPNPDTTTVLSYIFRSETTLQLSMLFV